MLRKTAEQEKQADCIIVLMITSSNDDRDKERARNYPFVKDFMGKPISKDDIEVFIKQYHPK